MNIGRTDGVGGPGRVEGPRKLGMVASSTGTSGPANADHVNLTQRAEILSKAMGLPQVRAERVAEVKKLIESGRFDTDTRLEGALKKFMVENSDL